MSVVRGSALSNYPELVSELGADSDAILCAAGIDPADIGNHEIFIPIGRGILALEDATTKTATADFGRRLALRQGIEILGPVGLAARTAATAAAALAILERFLSVYSPALSLRVLRQADPALSFVEFQITGANIPSSPQTEELGLGVTFRVLKGLFDFRPVSVHLSHAPIASPADYRRYFGARAYFRAPMAGFTMRSADLERPLVQDTVTHQIVVHYLSTIVVRQPPVSQSVRAFVRQLLPSGAVTVNVLAEQLQLHPKALQRQLAAEKTSFAAILDQVRRETAEHFLRHTDITLLHLARELGYAEQSVLTRACHRWFGTGPAAYRLGVGRRTRRR